MDGSISGNGGGGGGIIFCKSATLARTGGSRRRRLDRERQFCSVLFCGDGAGAVG